MKVCFFGLGSIAKRHIRNLVKIFDTDISIDLLRLKGKSEIPEDIKPFINKVLQSTNDIREIYDVMFITNPTKFHFESLKLTAQYAKHFFIEKPVFENYDEEYTSIEFHENSISYVACPLRYTNVIQYLKNNIDFNYVYSIRCISSSYLPDWRIGIVYRETYSAQRKLGGGVSIDLIHEWDYINYLVGTPLDINSLITKKSDLEIDSDDIAIYIAEYEKLLLEIHLDYFGRFPIRKIQLFSKEDTIEADLINQKINFLTKNKVIDLAEDRNEYQMKELLHFFNIISGKVQNDNDIAKAVSTLKLTKGIL